MTPPVLWTTAECAEYLGVEPTTFRWYVSTDKTCPRPVDGKFGAKGARLFRATEVRRWHKQRPGRGWRAGQTKERTTR